MLAVFDALYNSLDNTFVNGNRKDLLSFQSSFGNVNKHCPAVHQASRSLISKLQKILLLPGFETRHLSGT